MVNRGEEKVRVHMNVLPRSTGNTTLKLSRQSDCRSNPEVVGSIPTEVKRFFLCLVWFPVFPLLGLTPSGLFMGLSSTIIYTSELILHYLKIHYLLIALVDKE